MAEFLNDDPNAGWPGQIPEIATTDPVLGGPGGPVNVPHQLLADRTNYLKSSMGRLSDKVDALDLTVEGILANGGGAGNGGGGHDGGEGGNGAGGTGCGCPPPASGPDPGTAVIRDENGRAQVEAPALPNDIATKAYVDSKMPSSYVISVVGI